MGADKKEDKINGMRATFVVFDELTPREVLSIEVSIRKARLMLEHAQRKGHRHVRLRSRDVVALRGWSCGGNNRQRVYVLVDDVERWIVTHVTSRLVGDIE